MKAFRIIFLIFTISSPLFPFDFNELHGNIKTIIEEERREGYQINIYNRIYTFPNENDYNTYTIESTHRNNTEISIYVNGILTSYQSENDIEEAIINYSYETGINEIIFNNSKSIIIYANDDVVCTETYSLYNSEWYLHDRIFYEYDNHRLIRMFKKENNIEYNQTLLFYDGQEHKFPINNFIRIDSGDEYYEGAYKILISEIIIYNEQNIIEYSKAMHDYFLGGWGSRCEYESLEEEYQNLRIIQCYYNERGDWIEKQIYTIEGELFDRTYCEYIYDYNNNWISKTIYYNEYNRDIITRAIEYY